MKSYIQHLRSLIGHRKFIHPAARIIIENEKGEVLFVEKKDTGQLCIPAGGLEENESIEECIKREVREECGLRLRSLEVIGLSTRPSQESVSYPNGDEIQYFTVEFYSNDWEGEIAVQDEEEIRKARFLDASHAENLPSNEKSAFESLAFYRQHNRLMLK
ncbi:MAG: NUDIX domain-containing protein [Bacteroidota bacterium]